MFYQYRYENDAYHAVDWCPSLVVPVDPPVQDVLDTMLPCFLHERPSLFSSDDGLLYLSFRYNEGEIEGGYRNDKRLGRVQYGLIKK